MVDLIIRGGKVVDGTGESAFSADVLVDDGQISLIGDASKHQGETEWDATGKVVCPGFIDIHSHSDFSLLVNRFAESGVRQGITTVVTGNCGHGPAPAPNKALAKQVTIGFSENWGIDFTWTTFAEYLEALRSPGISINVAPLVPHGTVRLAVMGYDPRPASQKELDEMKFLVKEAISAGAVGFSTGLEYAPGYNADEDELVTLSEIAAEHGRIYASHIRNRGDTFEEAVDEALNIARRAGLPAQLSHLAPRPYADPTVFDKILKKIYDAIDNEGLQVGIDTFPDIWGPGPVVTLLPPWVYEGPHDEVLPRLKSPDVVHRCREYVDHPTNYLLRLGGFEKFYLTCSIAHPELVGKNFKEISEILELDCTDTIFRLVLDDDEDYYNVMLRHIYATPEDLDKLLQQPNCSLESDGVVAAPYGHLKNFVMNRASYGYTMRFIQDYVVDRKLFTLEEAIRKMTSLPADCARLDDRGRIKENMPADLVVLDLDKTADKTTDTVPNVHPSGVDLVVVNGQIVFENDKHTEALAGRILPG